MAKPNAASVKTARSTANSRVWEPLFNGNLLSFFVLQATGQKKANPKFHRKLHYKQQATVSFVPEPMIS
jgi:hypothetical protein